MVNDGLFSWLVEIEEEFELVTESPVVLVQLGSLVLGECTLFPEFITELGMGFGTLYLQEQ